MRLRFLYILSVCWMLAHLLVSCANKGMGPQGGPKDETPPVIKQEQPLNGSVNFAGNQLVITCNEYLQLKDAANQVFVSPPMRRAPIVKAVGKKVTVTFDEPLRDSTTYIIDFGKAICDLNEGNPIDGYSFAFSTGPEIDTLQMSGVLINAEDLNPVQNMMIGIHSDLRDSAFLEKTFVAIAKTDEEGRFTLRNLHAGKYHIYALADVSKDYVYQPGEGLAFLDTIFSPIAIDTIVVEAPNTLPDSLLADSALSEVSDTIAVQVVSETIAAQAEVDTVPSLLIDTVSYADSLAVAADSLMGALDSLQQDTVVRLKKQTRYLPDDIVLRYFTEDKRRMYFVRCLREEAHYFKLLFASPQDTMPRFTDLPPCYIQSSAGMDTLTVWLQDSAYIKQDTIDFTMTYQQTDSVYNIRWKTDSLRAIYRAPRLSAQQIATQEKQRLKDLKEGKVPVLEFKTNASQTFDLFESLRFTFPMPVYGPIGEEPMPEESRDSIADSVADGISVADSPVEVVDSVAYTDSVLVATDSLVAGADSLAAGADSLLENSDSLARAVHGEIHLFRLVPKEMGEGQAPEYDSLPEPYTFQKLDSCGSQYALHADWQPETMYSVELDSAAFTSIYGVSTIEKSLSLKVRSLEDYSTLILKIEPFNPDMMIQVLDSKEQVVRTLRADTAGTRFEYLQPESYYVRLYEDLNGDSVWTTGDWLHHLQPEPVYYFSTKVQLKANWDFEETVLWREKGILEQKPTEIRKAIDPSKKK